MLWTLNLAPMAVLQLQDGREKESGRRERGRNYFAAINSEIHDSSFLNNEKHLKNKHEGKGDLN